MVSHGVRAARPAVPALNEAMAPAHEFESDEVRQQLNRILLSPAFHNSKRYAAVLRFIVEQTLMGLGDQLKERTIGIEVFGRRPDYDTATDHAVRSAVAEVRKRLAQYYLHGSQGELRIEILPGCYMPQFRRAEEVSNLAPFPLPTATMRAKRDEVQVWPGTKWGRKWIFVAVTVAACALGCGAFLTVRAVDRAHDPLEAFWRPIISSHAPILLCVGNVEGGEASPPANAGLPSQLLLGDFQNSPRSTVNKYDAFTTARFAALLEAHGRDFRLASQSDATFTDLQTGPAILVGLLNNNWSERLMPKLRFTVVQPAPGKYVIRDNQNPSNNAWTVDYSSPYLDLSKDYALVLRMVDPKTEQTVLIDAGITVFGTSAAGNFLTNRREMRKLASIAPPGWEKKNIELVFSTDVIKGQSGPASIVAAQFW